METSIMKTSWYNWNLLAIKSQIKQVHKIWPPSLTGSIQHVAMQMLAEIWWWGGAGRAAWLWRKWKEGSSYNSLPSRAPLVATGSLVLILRLAPLGRAGAELQLLQTHWGAQAGLGCRGCPQRWSAGTHWSHRLHSSFCVHMRKTDFFK